MNGGSKERNIKMVIVKRVCLKECHSYVVHSDMSDIDHACYLNI